VLLVIQPRAAGIDVFLYVYISHDTRQEGTPGVHRDDERCFTAIVVLHRIVKKEDILVGF